MNQLNKIFWLLGILSMTFHVFGQEEACIISIDSIPLQLGSLPQWKYMPGHEEGWSSPSYDDTQWTLRFPRDISWHEAGENGRLEGWFRTKINLDSTLAPYPLFLNASCYSAVEVFIDGESVYTSGIFGPKDTFTHGNPKNEFPVLCEIPLEQDVLLAVHFQDYTPGPLMRNFFTVFTENEFIALLTHAYFIGWMNEWKKIVLFGMVMAIPMVLFLFFLLLAWLHPKETIIKIIAVCTFSLGAIPLFNYMLTQVTGRMTEMVVWLLIFLSLMLLFVSLPMLISLVYKNRIYRWLWIYALIGLLSSLVSGFVSFPVPPFFAISSFVIILYFIIQGRNALDRTKRVIVIGLMGTLVAMVIFGINLISQGALFSSDSQARVLVLSLSYLIFPISLLIYVSLWLRNSNLEIKTKAEEVISLNEEKKRILEEQNVMLERKVAQRTMDLNKSLENLKSTQAQLIHSEKMASLGELTAGIAHEIQNPLNFVNNFSDVSVELADELEEEMEAGNQEESQEILADLKENLDKIHHHGQRASSIVKGMLDHSRASSDQKEQTDINALCDEYLRLAYHGLRAKDRSFQSAYSWEPDEELPKLYVVPQDIGRVILNLINNAFQAVSARASAHDKGDYSPSVHVGTRSLGDRAEIIVTDNGSGIPANIKNKIFQPFFTTKPAGEGTGLGLSLSYDIVKAHGGSIEVDTFEGEGTTFRVFLPISNKS
jgi:signal transduction histidine kinase